MPCPSLLFLSLLLEGRCVFTDKFKNVKNDGIKELFNRAHNEEAFAQEPETKNDKSIISGIFEWLDVITTAIIAVVLIFTFLFRVATIDGQSMENTLFNNEKVIITNFGYIPRQGDIVVISRNVKNSVENETQSELPIIKRVIATEGQTVDIDFEKGTVYVDGVLVDDSYTKTPTNLKYDIEFPVIVDKNCIFVLGDNRNDSLDSRSSRIGNDGMIDTRYVLGHAVLRIFPFNKIGGL